MITTAKRRVRRDFAPLELFTNIVTASAGSGVMQVYDGATGEHEPDRSITPLVLVPYVLAEAPDGSFSGGDVREQLRNGRWYVNGTAIESATGWSGGFTVSQEAGTKWQLTVQRNFTPGERADLTFRAELADTRTGVLVPVTCGPVTLTCTERASDMWALMTGGDTIMIYDPLRDNLLRHDYLVAEGQEAESAPAREALEKEQTSYVRRVPVELWRGGEKWAHPWALIAAKIGPSGELTRVRAGDGDLVSCDDSTGLVMDLRLTEKTDLALLACVAAADAGTAGTDAPVSVGVAMDEGVDLSLSRSFKAGDNIATGTDKLYGGQTGQGGMVSTQNDDGSITVTANGYNDFTGFYRGNIAILADALPEAGDFVISFEMRSPDTTVIPTIYVNSAMGYRPMVGKLGTDWSQVYAACKYAYSTGPEVNLHLGFQAVPPGAHIDVRRMKIEIGTVPTPWSLSPIEELKCVARAQVSAERVDAAFSAEIQNTADIAAGDTRRAQRAVVSAGGGTAEHAEAVLEMTWKTDTKAKAGTVVGYGRAADFALAETGLTEAYDDYMDVYLEMDDRGPMAEAVDEDGNVLTDEDGNVLVFN